MNMTDALKTPVKRRRKKIVGRGKGCGRGKTCGRGEKGAKARSGFRQRAYYEGGTMPLVRRLPKRGFNNRFFQAKTAIVNLKSLERFDAGTVVDPELLKKSGIVSGSFDRLKVLGKGEVTKALTVKAHAFSGSAAEKITKAGGKAEVLKD